MTNELQAKVGDKVVSVQVLRVDGKKLTLQFFRQIPTEDWLDEQLELRTDISIWGRVNYKIPKEGFEWLVVQVGDQLRRCHFYRPTGEEGMLSYYQRTLDRAHDSVAKLIDELAAKQREVDAEASAGVKAVLVGWRDRLKTSLYQARAEVVKCQAEVDKAMQAREQACQRRARYDELSPGQQQLFLG
jgi:hypothetical protein